MIFVTVGSQTPFDRLVKLVDNWAGENPATEIFAQIGMSDYCPKNFEFVDILTPSDYKSVFMAADLIVSHAGMGTIISALQAGKPLLMMTRSANLGETRNSHQVGTARRFADMDTIYFVQDESDFDACIRRALLESTNKLSQPGLNEVSENLVRKITEFIDT